MYPDPTVVVPVMGNPYKNPFLLGICVYNPQESLENTSQIPTGYTTSTQLGTGKKELDHLQRKKLLCEDEMTSLGVMSDSKLFFFLIGFTMDHFLSKNNLAN